MELMDGNVAAALSDFLSAAQTYAARGSERLVACKELVLFCRLVQHAVGGHDFPATEADDEALLELLVPLTAAIAKADVLAVRSIVDGPSFAELTNDGLHDAVSKWLKEFEDADRVLTSEGQELIDGSDYFTLNRRLDQVYIPPEICDELTWDNVEQLKQKMMRWQFDEAFLGKLDACDSIRIDWNIWLTGPHVEGRLKLDQKSFCAIHERKQLVFPEVIIGPDYDCGYAWNLNGVERLSLLGRQFCNDIPPHLVHLIDSNKDSLKVLKLPRHMFSLILPGLKLEEFATSAESEKLEVPERLDTKIFTCSCSWSVPLPPAFVRTVNADEIHLITPATRRIEPNAPDSLAPEPANSRVKRMSITVSEGLDDYRFDGIVQKAAVMCPELEHFEVTYKHPYARPMFESDSDWWHRHYDARYLMDEFDRALEECHAVFRIRLQAFFHYAAKSSAEASDFARLHFNVDLPPVCRVHDDEPEHYHLVKEATFDTKTLRMDFKVSMRN